MTATPRLFALLLLPLTAAAQSPVVSVDVGGARMRLADSISANALSVSPALRVSNARASFAASGTVSRLGVATTESASLDAAVGTTRRGMLSGELQAIAGGSRHDDGTATGQWIALARLNVTTAGKGVWFGGGLGRTSDGMWRSLVQGDLGAWRANDATVAALTVSPTVVDDTIAYADVLLSAHHERGAWELDGSVGGRGGNQLPSMPADRRLWGNASAIRWLTSNVGVVASAGAYPVDLAQGYPGGRYVSLSVRWRPIMTRPARDTVSTPIRQFRVRAVSDNRYELRAFAPTARSVEIAGDFSGWSPVNLVSDSRGWWAATIALASGPHEISVRSDGGPWTAPPGLTPLTDEFGGRAGLLVIPE